MTIKIILKGATYEFQHQEAKIELKKSIFDENISNQTKLHEKKIILTTMQKTVLSTLMHVDDIQIIERVASGSRAD